MVRGRFLCETMRSLTSPLARHISGPRNFCSSPKKDFFNTIGTSADVLPILMNVWYREGGHEQTCRHLRQRTLRISILNLMDEDDPTDEISRIEARLEELAETSERCRKIILVSKAAIAGGVTLLLVTMLGLFGSNAVAALGSIAVVLGGIVSLGSHVSTLQQTMAAISAAEVLRSDMISQIDLRVVGEGTMKLI
jgi:hypothetical protein